MNEVVEVKAAPNDHDGLRRGSSAVACRDYRFESPQAAWMSVCCECCMLSGRGHVGLITRPEKSYRMWCAECDREVSIIRRPWLTSDCRTGGMD
jgi:hypothetical protein